MTSIIFPALSGILTYFIMGFLYQRFSFGPGLVTFGGMLSPMYGKIAWAVGDVILWYMVYDSL
jgi:hypothetical protein